MKCYRYTLWFHTLGLWLSATLLPKVNSDKLDAEISNALFEPPSSRCASLPTGQSTTFTFDFFSTQNISNWNCINKQFEEDAFEVEMSHTGGTFHQAWNLRIGKGGDISSFRGPYGEAMANQASASASWNDLVTQVVSVNNAFNTPKAPNFVHQSGVYNKDTGLPDSKRQCGTRSTETPFYSPTLALKCSGNQCSMVNWGQQAHVPTIHRSDLLYYTRFRDCGDGIIEYDQMIHHFGDDPKDVYTYFNTPWTGVRTSTFQDMMIANKNGTLEHHFPLTGFADATNIRNLDATGGFTTFAEDLALRNDTFDPGFCVKDTNTSEGVANVDCRTPGSVPLKLQVQVNDSVKESPNHSARFGFPIFYMQSCNLQKPIYAGGYGFGNAPKGLYFTNNRTGFTVQVPQVVHWCLNGRLTYFSPNVTVDVMNKEFRADDVITITMASEGKGAEQYGFTFVHGKNREYGEPFYRAKSRLRFGVAGNPLRDGTVWTTNFIGDLPMKSTYWNRKYFISDQLKEMEGKARGIVGNEDTMEDVMKVSELSKGNQITLYFDASSFGAAIGKSPQCGTHTQACIGSSTPKKNYKPLFYITCGSKSYIGYDAYHFAVAEGDIKKPYLCRGESASTRAVWKLLGYFPAKANGSCNALGGESNRTYSSTFCDSNEHNDPGNKTETTGDCAWLERKPLEQNGKDDGLDCPTTCDTCKFFSCKGVVSLICMH